MYENGKKEGMPNEFGKKKQTQLSADWPKYKAKKAKIDYESYASRDE
jgi:hypothetical protein